MPYEDKGRGSLQGISKRLFPGCEKVWWKNCVCLPEVGKQNATFSPDFTQPGKSLLEIPCNLQGVPNGIDFPIGPSCFNVPPALTHARHAGGLLCVHGTHGPVKRAHSHAHARRRRDLSYLTSKCLRLGKFLYVHCPVSRD